MLKQALARRRRGVRFRNHRGVQQQEIRSMKLYLNSSAPPRPYRPIDYSKPSVVVEVAQAIAGAGLGFAALFAWESLSTFLAGGNLRPWVLLGFFALLLVAIDALARGGGGWGRLRGGFIFG